MKKQLLLPLGLLTCMAIASCDNGTTTTTTSDSTASATAAAPPAAMTTTTTTTISETDPYVDLNTGKSIKIHRDAQSGTYAAESGGPLDIYVNTNTHDTFYGPSARTINNMVIHSGNRYTVDEARMNAGAGSGESSTMDNNMNSTDNSTMDNSSMSDTDNNMSSGNTGTSGDTKTKTKTKVNDHKTKIKEKTVTH